MKISIKHALLVLVALAACASVAHFSFPGYAKPRNPLATVSETAAVSIDQSSAAETPFSVDASSSTADGPTDSPRLAIHKLHLSTRARRPARTEEAVAAADPTAAALEPASPTAALTEAATAAPTAAPSVAATAAPTAASATAAEPAATTAATESNTAAPTAAAAATNVAATSAPTELVAVTAAASTALPASHTTSTPNDESSSSAESDDSEATVAPSLSAAATSTATPPRTEASTAAATTEPVDRDAASTAPADAVSTAPTTPEDIIEGIVLHALAHRAAHARAISATANPTSAAALSTATATAEPTTPRVPKQVNPAGAMPPVTGAQPVSIVLVCANEALLPKTIESILAVRSAELINEILVIDDRSDSPVRYEDLPRDARVHIVRARERLGLIRARMAGGEIARGPFMVLIDGHTKPYDDWLVPIVKLLRENYKRLLNMEVGLLDAKTWLHIEPNAMGRKAGFNYNLHHFWEPERTADELTKLAGHTITDLDDSPITMGMFATSKRWWQEIGGMDTGMETWGAENIEISLKTWLCGGEIRVARGSRIDHTFRDKQPYKMDGDAWERNLARVAETWLNEEWRDKFYKAAQKQRGQIHIGNLDNVHALQKRLKCKPFSWYADKFRGRTPVEKNP